MASHILNII